MLDRRYQEVRAHVPYLVHLLTLVRHKDEQLVRFALLGAEHNTSYCFTVGTVQHQNGWHSAPRPTIHDGSRPFHAPLAIASHVLRIRYVCTMKACKGVVFLHVFKRHAVGEVFMWRRGSDASEVAHFSLRVRI